jgi:hypothetical protein
MRIAAALSIALVVTVPVGAQDPPADADLAAGIALVQEGDFDGAVVALDSVVRRLVKAPNSAKPLARAYTYLAIAYLGLSQEQMAKANFLEAWKTDREMELSPREFPPRILRFLEEAAQEARRREGGDPGSSTDTAAAGTSAQPTTAPAPVPKKKSKTLPVLLGVAAAGGIGVAVAGGGGSSGPSATTPPVTTAPAPSATVSSAQAGQVINCTVQVVATITVTNPGRDLLSVTAVRRSTTTTAGTCPTNTASYAPSAGGVGAGQTAVVFSRSLYSGGAGCCLTTPCANVGNCSIRHAFTVETSGGTLDAGSFSYNLVFDGCEQCPSGTAAADGACVPVPSSGR